MRSSQTTRRRASAGGGGRGSARGALGVSALCWLTACSSEPGPPTPPDPGDPAGGGGEEEELEFPLYEQGQVLARLETAAPAPADFVLRGTVPLPRGVYPLQAGWSPFALRDGAGVAAPAQTEIVSRYARATDGADVVEVLARVARPAGSAPGERLEFDVVWAPHPPAEPSQTAQVADLVQTAGALELRTRDVFGHPYSADLLRDEREGTAERVVQRHGALARRVRTHENLLSPDAVGAPDGALPHHLGVHAYVTLWSDEDFLSLDLRLHNGHDGLDPDDPLDDPMGMLYFDALELCVPEGWVVLSAFDDPLLGEPYAEGARSVVPLVAAAEDATLHLVPPRSQFHRRLVVTRAAAADRARACLREETLAFCRPGSVGGLELFSWWNPATARFFPQKEPLPRLDHQPLEHWRDELSESLAAYEAGLAAGTADPYPLLVENLGWAHPWGPSVGYAHGGGEIFLYQGLRPAWAASADGYRLTQLVHRAMTDRHPTALYDGDGDAFSEEDWIHEGPDGPIMPLWMFMIPWLASGDPFGFLDAPTFQSDAVAAAGLAPPYEQTLLSYDHIDNQHLVRYTRSPKVLAWLGNDALARDDLRLQAECVRSSFSALPQDDYGNRIPTGMLRRLEDVAARPGDGFLIDRGEGWYLDTVAAAFSLGDEDWRARVFPWFERILGLLEDGQLGCNGVFGSTPNSVHFEGAYRLRQSISEAILQHGLWGVRASVFGQRRADLTGRLDAILAPNLAAMISEAVWNDEMNAPATWAAMGPFDVEQPSFCESIPPGATQGGDSYQTWSSFAYGFRLTGNWTFLDRAAEMLGAPLSTSALGTEAYGHIENRAALMSLVQELWE
ncbi:MAG: hypothetical protein QF410_11735 [Planctomycetota bacterium]|nr:hypothetical protein [Planctomycetota bacterium]MDP6762157.1 hypothetical protein [Planctomycetota bacterium]